jgi:PKD repeat protein
MKYIIFIAISLTIFSCKRETYPESTTESPVFKMSGTLDGEPFSLSAGQNGIYLTSDAVQNSYGVYQLHSQFMDVNCQGCLPIFDFQITNNEAQKLGDPCNPDVLEIGEVQIATLASSSNFQEIHFHAPNQPGNEYEWDFGDGNTGNGENPHHQYESPGLYTVTLEIGNDSGPDDVVVLTQQILVGMQEFISMPFNVVNLPGEDWQFEYGSLPPNLQALSWTINGQEFFGNNIEFSGDDDINVCLHFINTSLNQTGFYCLEFDGESNGQISDFFSYQWEGQNLNFGKAECLYRSPSGSTYTSVTELNQNPDSFFEFQSIEDYDAQIDGRLAKKIQTSFDLLMINTTNPDDIIHFENVTTTLGFAVE